MSQTRRILAVYRSADAQQLAAGREWYVKAHESAAVIAATHALSLRQSAGIIAALSPQVSWGFNLEWANGVAAGDTTPRGLSLSLGRALMIQRNPDTDPLDILGGRKVRAFYAAILCAGETSEVVIDRHAYDIAEGTRGAHLTLTDRRSRLAAESYRAAAARLRTTGEDNLTACQLQAVTWVAWRARYWAPGAWDGYAEDKGRAPVAETVAF